MTLRSVRAPTETELGLHRAEPGREPVDWVGVVAWFTVLWLFTWFLALFPVGLLMRLGGQTLSFRGLLIIGVSSIPLALIIRSLLRMLRLRRAEMAWRRRFSDHVEELEVIATDVIGVEEFEDEGESYFFDLGDGQWVWMFGTALNDEPPEVHVRRAPLHFLIRRWKSDQQTIDAEPLAEAVSPRGWVDERDMTDWVVDGRVLHHLPLTEAAAQRLGLPASILQRKSKA